MKWLFLVVAVALAGCGGGGSAPDMKAVAAAIRAMPEEPSSNFTVHGVAKADKLEYDIEEDGSIVKGHSWMRFPASDGFVWVRVNEQGDKSSVVHSSIQFSQSGKRE